VANIVVLKGGMGRKQRREVNERLAAIPESEPRLILATGSYIAQPAHDSGAGSISPIICGIRPPATGFAYGWAVLTTARAGPISPFVRNTAILLTGMETLATSVVNHVGKLPEGVPVSAKELLHLGTRAAVDQTLSRLVRRGSLIRVGRGLYVRPIEGRFGVRPPESATVVRAIVEHRGENVVPHGAAAANELGLTTQVPLREVYLTSGPTRKLKLGNQTVELRHAPAWQLALPGRKAGALIRALAWLGPEQASYAVEAARGKLPESELNAVVELRRMLPTWMAQQVSKLAAHA
jgi:hypothetical protein